MLPLRKMLISMVVALVMRKMGSFGRSLFTIKRLDTSSGRIVKIVKMSIQILSHFSPIPKHENVFKNAEV